MKNIILIAPPSAGKGTISKILSEKYHLPHISVGDLLRASVESDDEQGNYIKQQMNSGKLVSDELIINLIENRITKEDCKNGYILDGFPRNINQAKKYDELVIKHNIKNGIVILLDISYEKAKKRILGRVSCPNCGAVYNIYSLDTRPRVAGICDTCGSCLVRRNDDTEEIFANRFDIYLSETKPTIEYYEKQGVIHKIDSSMDLSKVLEEIEEILENNND